MNEESEQTDLMFDNEFRPSEDDLEIYRIVFELFDRDHSGYIDAGDLRVISTKLGRDPVESKWCQLLANLFLVFNLIRQFDMNNDDKISFSEFVHAMVSIENK